MVKDAECARAPACSPTTAAAPSRQASRVELMSPQTLRRPPLEPSESGGHCRAERARLNVVEQAPVVRATAVDVVGDTAGVAYILAVQLKRPAAVLEPGAQ